MKTLKICFVMLLFFYFLPLGAISHSSDHPDDTTEHGHCILMCHALCTHAVIPKNATPALISVTPIKRLHPSTASFPYQNPFLDSFKRPPIVSA